jgi:hypothetical protein
MPGHLPSRSLRFGGFELDVSAYELRRQGRSIKVERRPMELLIHPIWRNPHEPQPGGRWKPARASRRRTRRSREFSSCSTGTGRRPRRASATPLRSTRAPRKTTGCSVTPSRSRGGTRRRSRRRKDPERSILWMPWPTACRPRLHSPRATPTLPRATRAKRSSSSRTTGSLTGSWARPISRWGHRPSAGGAGGGVPAVQGKLQTCVAVRLHAGHERTCRRGA